jgi:hypothetical protein
MTQRDGESADQWFRRRRWDAASENMVNAVVTEIPLRLEPVTADAFETDGPTEAEREVVLARIAALFGSSEPRRAIMD